MGSRAAPGEARVIKLSDVKVRVQYRLRVRQRLMVLHFARLHGPTAAGRRFGVSVRTIRRWRARWRQDTLQVIELIGQARRDLAYGAQRTQLWLRRVHDVRVAVGTIQRIFRDLGLPRLRRTPKRVPRQMKLFEKAEPGESVQVDVKFVKIAGRWAFQYTALDDCTRFRVLRLYRRLHQSSSLAFLAELCRAFPFPIRKLQCDNGHEFPFAFALAVQTLGIRHRYIKPRRPQQNGKVERSHRIDQEEFWGRARFADFDAAAAGLRAWETRYNHQRFSLALQGRTPAEKLATLWPPPAA
jgi:transposase InsO family protein